MRLDADRLQRAIRRHARREYVRGADAPFTSGNLTTQRMDVVRLPLAGSVRLDGQYGPLFIVGLSMIGGADVIR